MIKNYVFDGIKYLYEYVVRQAIFEKNRTTFGKLQTTKEWLELGVEYTEEEEVIPLEQLKLQKSNQIKNLFLSWRVREATLTSSLGFKVDSNERANTDIGGLIIAYEDIQDELITFRDYDNQFHKLTYEQLKILQKEIIENGSYAYFQKWTYEDKLECATTKEGVEAIKVEFVGKNFSVKA